MGGRHRAPREWPEKVGSALLLALVLGAAASLWALRGEIRELFGSRSPAQRVRPSPPPSGPERTGASPSPARERRGRLVIHGTGDVNLDPGYIPNLGVQGYEYAWSGLEGLFLEDDLTVVNLECTASDLGAPVEKAFNFRCDPAALPAMGEAGVEVASQANNHAGDFGPRALIDSRRNLARARIAPVGTGRDQRQAAAPAIFELRGWKVAVLGFGGVVPDPSWLAGPDHPGMADGDDTEGMVRAVRLADRIADLVFVTIHWGIELDTTPRPDDVERAHAMIDAGADGIFGHHTHRLQPLDHYRGRPIAWGLGNFVWPNFSEAGATTAVAEFVVTPRGKVRGRLLPAFIESAGHPVLRTAEG